MKGSKHNNSKLKKLLPQAAKQSSASLSGTEVSTVSKAIIVHQPADDD